MYDTFYLKILYLIFKSTSSNRLEVPWHQSHFEFASNILNNLLFEVDVDRTISNRLILLSSCHSNILQSSIAMILKLDTFFYDPFHQVGPKYVFGFHMAIRRVPFVGSFLTLISFRIVFLIRLFLNILQAIVSFKGKSWPLRRFPLQKRYCIQQLLAVTLIYRLIRSLYLGLHSSMGSTL